MTALHRSLRALMTLGGLAILMGAGCQGASHDANASNPPATTPVATQPEPAVPASTFDADRAFADLKKQVAFGTRVPGTTPHRETRDWIVAELKKTCDSVQLQDFPFDVSASKQVTMSNIVAQINPSAKRQIMLSAHWDTRPTADQEVDPAKKKQPIPGANDGASGVAVLLELARAFKATRPDVGVQLIFWDGEDYGPGLERMFLGARYYAKKPALPKPDFAILIDMIGDKDLNISRERNSENRASEINDKVWAAAKALNIPQFNYGVKYEIEDDHLPLQDAGFKIIDLIDFDYAPWHTLDDTPDKCSGASLKAVGDVLARVVYSEKP